MDDQRTQLLEMIAQNDPNLAQRIQVLNGWIEQTRNQDASRKEERVRKLRARWTRMEQERASLREKNHLLTAALGACECWGEDTRCPHCRGRGFPGAFEPDEDAFNHFVRPVLERAGWELSTRSETEEH